LSSLNSIDSMKRISLHDELTERLRGMITEGVLAAGEKVPERELCDKLGVSRTPMREALKVLAADGLLNLEPNKGARVHAITVQDLEEVFPVMGALEALAGELACENITQEQLTELKSAHAAMVTHFHESDLPNYFKKNELIHEIIIKSTGNKTLLTMYRSLSVRLRSARYLANITPDRWSQAVAEHEAMIAALDKRDSTMLSAILRQHLQNKFSSVKAFVENQSTTKTN